MKKQCVQQAIGVVIAMTLSIATIVSIGTTAVQAVYAETATTKMSDADSIAKSVKPAVVFVFQIDNVSVSAPRLLVDTQALREEVTQLANNGQLDLSDSRAVLDTLIGLIYHNPSAYLTPSSTEVANFEIPLVGSGSGFIATSDGYIVTNAHVATPPSSSEVTHSITNSKGGVFKEKAAHDSILIIRNLFSEAFPDIASLNLTGEEVAPLYAVILQYYLDNFYVNGVIDSSVYVHSKLILPGAFRLFGDDQGPEVVPAQVLADATGTSPGEDVAILKIDAGDGSNLPTIPLGDEQSLKTLDDLIAVGYPGSVTRELSSSSNGVVSLADIAPSVSEGKFSGFQPSGYGFDYLEASIASAHGSSGSPVVDLSGNVLGIVTLTTMDSDGSDSPFKLLIPVSVIKDHLNKAGVNIEGSNSNGSTNSNGIDNSEIGNQASQSLSPQESQTLTYPDVRNNEPEPSQQYTLGWQVANKFGEDDIVGL